MGSMPGIRDVVVLGSTGSIGTQALEIVRANPDRFRVVGLTAGGSRPDLFEAQVREFAPARSGVGEDASVAAAAMECDVVLNGMTGAVGLRPTVAALEAGNVLALANKESLIIGIPFERIDVVVHPTSVVHSMVEFVDGSTLAQASPPSMLIPISLGLGWPDRVPEAAPAVDWSRPQAWEFFPLDDEAFPAVRLARAAGSAGGVAPAVYNAANEVCVEAFRGGSLPFTGIVRTVEEVLAEALSGGWARVRSKPEDLTVEDVLAADARARAAARDIVQATTGEGTTG